MTSKDRIVFLGTYPPRLCGIATFTQDLSRGVSRVAPDKFDTRIIALNNEGTSFDYPPEVVSQITAQKIPEYLEVANMINEDDRIKLVSIQHEFKIFGSDGGENLLPFMDAVKKPMFTTLHSIPFEPTSERKKSLQEVVRKSECVVAMAYKGENLLRNDYGLKDECIKIIPHGIHDRPFVPQGPIKKQLGYEGKTLLISFGFLRAGRKKRSSGRGYEDVLEALPQIVKKFPDVLYLILGDTHPVVYQKEGDKYYHFLLQRVKELGLEKHVKFIKRYLPLEELITYLQAADIYICSNLNPAQITSGTLVYALGAGRAVVSTPFVHAAEIIEPAHGGLLTEFGNPDSIAEDVIKILDDPKFKKELEENAYKYTRHMTYTNVGKEYYKQLFSKYL